MGVQDRDWYRDWWKKREDGERGDGLPPPSLPRYLPPVKKVVRWHPVLTALVTVGICLAVWAVVRFVARLHG